MAYIKTTWANREVEKPRTYIQTTNGDGTITLTPAEGDIISVGTPITAENMNNIENWIAGADPSITSYGTRLNTAETNISKKLNVYIDTDGTYLMRRACDFLYGSRTPNANFLISVQDTEHAQHYLILAAHYQDNSHFGCTILFQNTLTYVQNTVGTLSISGLAGTPRFAVIGLSGNTWNGAT